MLKNIEAARDREEEFEEKIGNQQDDEEFIKAQSGRLKAEADAARQAAEAERADADAARARLEKIIASEGAGEGQGYMSTKERMSVLDALKGKSEEKKDK